jgi:hypothetical protein
MKATEAQAIAILMKATEAQAIATAVLIVDWLSPYSLH